MKIEASEIQRNGFVIYKSRYENVLNKYRVMLNDACIKLYDACYLSTPSMFILNEVVKAMNEEFRKYIGLFVSNIDSTFVWTAKRCEYAIAVAKAKQYDEEFISLVEMLKNALYCQEALDALNDLALHSKIRTKDRVYDVINPRISISTKVNDSSSVGFSHRVFLEVAEYTSKGNIRVCDTKNIEYRKALEMMGMSTAKAEKVIKSKIPVFTDCLSFDDECKFLGYFLSGSVKATGRVAKHLDKILADENTYSLTKNGISTVEKFSHKVFSQSLADRCDVVTSYRKTLSEEFKSVYPVYVDDDCVFFGVSNEEGVTTRRSAEQIQSRVDNELNFSVPTRLYGANVTDYETGTPLPMYFALRGMLGEYIAESDVFKNGYFANGKVIKTKFFVKSRTGVKEVSRAFYSINDVYYSDERNSKGELVTKSLKAKVGDEVAFVEYSEDKLFDLFNVESKTELYFCIRNYLSNAELCYDSTGYLDLVADLLCAFMYFKSGIGVYDMYNTGYGYVDKSMYNAALFDADRYLLDISE